MAQYNKEGSPSSRKGFAAMNEEKQREIASMGGKAAHESGHAHEFDSESGRAAGRIGGQHRAQNRKNKDESPSVFDSDR